MTRPRLLPAAPAAAREWLRPRHGHLRNGAYYSAQRREASRLDAPACAQA